MWPASESKGAVTSSIFDHGYGGQINTTRHYAEKLARRIRPSLDRYVFSLILSTNAPSGPNVPALFGPVTSSLKLTADHAQSLCGHGDDSP